MEEAFLLNVCPTGLLTGEGWFWMGGLVLGSKGSILEGQHGGVPPCNLVTFYICNDKPVFVSTGRPWTLRTPFPCL